MFIIDGEEANADCFFCFIDDGEYLLDDATEKMMMMIDWLQIHHLVSAASC